MGDPYNDLNTHLHTREKKKKKREREYLPIQRNRHSTQPRPDRGAQRSSPNGIHRSLQRPDLSPDVAVDAVDVYQRQDTQQGHVRRAEESMREVCREGGAEEDEEDSEDGGAEESGKEKREKRSLFSVNQIDAGI